MRTTVGTAQNFLFTTHLQNSRTGRNNGLATYCKPWTYCAYICTYTRRAGESISSRASRASARIASDSCAPHLHWINDDGAEILPA